MSHNPLIEPAPRSHAFGLSLAILALAVSIALAGLFWSPGAQVDRYRINDRMLLDTATGRVWVWHSNGRYVDATPVDR